VNCRWKTIRITTSRELQIGRESAMVLGDKQEVVRGKHGSHQAIMYNSIDQKHNHH
jgi:hypothetical protein